MLSLTSLTSSLVLLVTVVIAQNPCTDGQTYNSFTNLCGCPQNSFATPAGSEYPCLACPMFGESEPASDSCYCSGPSPQNFAVFEGVPSCCPTESTPNPTPRSGGPICSCANPAQTFNPTSYTCDCPVNTFGVYSSDDSSKACVSCPSNGSAPAGAEGCTCNAGFVTQFDYEGNMHCLSCVFPGSTYDYTTNQCRCDSPRYFYNVFTHSCSSCPVGTFADPSGILCVCALPYEEFDNETGLCLCQRGPNASDCACFGDATSQIVNGAATCVCPSGQTYTDGVGCSGAGPSAKAKRSIKRQKLEFQQLLQQADWRELSDEMLCPNGQQACPVMPSMRGYECVDTASEIDSCGGCISLGLGVDCLAIPGVKSATCSSGVCQAYSCLPGWVPTVVRGAHTCRRA